MTTREPRTTTEERSNYHAQDLAALRRMQLHPASPEVVQEVLNLLYPQPTPWEERLEASRIAIRETIRTGVPHTVSDFLEHIIEGPLTEADATALEAYREREAQMTFRTHFLGGALGAAVMDTTESPVN